MSAGLLLRGGMTDGFGCGSIEVDRFASSSVLGGVETGCVGGLLAIGRRPAHPVIALAQMTAHVRKMTLRRNEKFKVNLGSSASRNRRPLKKIPSWNYFLFLRASSRAIQPLRTISRKLPAGTAPFSFLFQARHLPRQIA